DRRSHRRERPSQREQDPAARKPSAGRAAVPRQQQDVHAQRARHGRHAALGARGRRRQHAGPSAGRRDPEPRSAAHRRRRLHLSGRARDAAPGAAANTYVYGSIPSNTYAGQSDAPQIFYATLSPTVLSPTSTIKISAITTTNVQ